MFLRHLICKDSESLRKTGPSLAKIFINLVNHQYYRIIGASTPKKKAEAKDQAPAPATSRLRKGGLRMRCPGHRGVISPHLISRDDRSIAMSFANRLTLKRGAVATVHDGTVFNVMQPETLFSSEETSQTRADHRHVLEHADRTEIHHEQKRAHNVAGPGIAGKSEHPLGQPVKSRGE